MLKVATFNMWGGSPHQAQVKSWLSALDADIVLLQEVPSTYAHNGFIEMQSHYPYQFREETPEQWWSNAVLSKDPIESVKLYDAREGYFSTRQRIVVRAGDRDIAV